MINKRAKCILLNGPPQSGKDTAALAIVDYFKNKTTKVFYSKVSTPVLKVFQNLFGYSDEEWPAKYEEMKKTPIEELKGIDLRQAIIRLIEEHLKPNYGVEFLAKMCIKDIESKTKDLSEFYIISEIGFKEELLAFIEFFGIYNILIIHIDKDNCDYNDDSRKYIIPGLNDIPSDIASIWVTNNGSIKDFESKILDVVYEFIYL